MPEFKITQRTVEPLLKAERPFENRSLHYPSVLRVQNEWRMWYSAYDQTYRDDNDVRLCYATSPDGIHWERPNLGVVEYAGNTANNILLDGRRAGGMHGMTVFLDECAGLMERYKLVFTRGESRPGGWLEWIVYGAVSPDGIHWKLLPAPLLNRNSDTQTVCFRDREQYRLYVRQWSGGTYHGKRIVGYSESPTFGNFPEPVTILVPVADDPPDMQFYNSAATKLREGLYVMFPSGFYIDDQTVRPHLAVSCDGKNFERVGRAVALPLGAAGAFDSQSIYVAPGAIPGPESDTYWFYYAGYTIRHDGQPDYAGGVGRFLLTVTSK
ncbi:MAG: hypothetical protein PCFJNLEI_03004 [Verrucomicrobiae bacterium]|nr:hypothetical protein [Verrucomicrobiae bacterium]